MKQALILTAAAVAALITVAGNAGAGGAADSFSVDPVHSSLIFRIKYAGMSSFYGRFNEYSGTFAVDESNLEECRFDISVKSASIDSGNSKRDGHLRSPDFFSSKQHSDMRFVSKKAKKTGNKTLRVTGDLTLRGVTKEVTAEVTYGGQKAGRRGGIRAGFDGSLTIRREDFGITFGGEMLGPDVTILMGLSGVKK